MSCIATILASSYEVSPASMLGVILACARTNELELRTRDGARRSAYSAHVI